MQHRPTRFLLAVLLLVPSLISAAEVRLRVETPMAPPNWAVMERELLRANVDACREFYQRYFDDRGYLLCVERWGGDDGPDDAIENLLDWPILHALGASDDILKLYKHAWEGHLRQFTLARTTDVPMARDGMYYKEFPVSFDWLHNGEGLVVFNLQGLSDPQNQRFGQRVRRYAGFYLNEDPDAPNYDARHRIIRSLFNGSRGPLMRKATALDWAGDPIEIGNRFRPGHGERTYEEMLAHFQDYTDIIGDHPQNLLATSLPLNAYLLTHDEKYRKWLLEYVDAWVERMQNNGGVIPTNIGLDGKIGSAANGKWYGGVYGWGFSVKVPQTGELAHRNTHYLGIVGFGNAYLLTGDDRYLAPWRKMINLINRQGKMVDGQMMYPHMFGDQGWYHFTTKPYDQGAVELWYWSMSDADRRQLIELTGDSRLTAGSKAPVASHADTSSLAQTPSVPGWMAFLEGRNPGFPEQAMRHDFQKLRQRVSEIRADTSTPDTRLSDDSMRLNPVAIDSLNHLMQGGISPGRRGSVLHCRVRYFDPRRNRAGIPDDVAALVREMTADSTTLTLVNVNQVQPREVIVQAGAYAEHQFETVSVNGATAQPVHDHDITVRLEPGCGTTLKLETRRYVNQPTMTFPWDR